MIKVKDDNGDEFALEARQMHELPRGYKMLRSDLRTALKNYVPGQYWNVPYGYTGSPEVHRANFMASDGHISIGCCDFFNAQAKKLRQWAMARERKTNDSTSTRKRTSKGTNRNRKAAPKAAVRSNRKRTSLSRTRQNRRGTGKAAVAKRRIRAR